MENPLLSRVVVKSSRLDRAYIELLRDSTLYNTSLAEVLRHIARVCGQQLQASRVSIWTLDANFTTLQCLTLYAADTDTFDEGGQLFATDFPDYFSALGSHRVIDAHDARKDPRTREFAQSYLIPKDIYSMLDATLRQDEETQGVLCIEETGKPRIWNREEQIFSASLADLISRLMIQSQLKDREIRYRTLFENSHESIFVIVDGMVVDCNKAALELLRCKREQLINTSADMFIPSNQPEGLISSDRLRAKVIATRPGEYIKFEWCMIDFEQSAINVEATISKEVLDGEFALFLMVKDVTASKKADELLHQSYQELIHRARYDRLTNLPNRDYLHELMADMIGQMSSGKLGLFLLDLNRFKEVNDTLGHAAGDQLLQQVAARLSASVEDQGATVFRLGGDEFVILFRNIVDETHALSLAETINHALHQPVRLGTMSLELGGSAGIALFPEHGRDSHALLRCADVAMYRAKSQGLAAVVYDSDLDVSSPRRLILMADLGKAIREDQLTLHYQPRIDLITNQCSGCEALLRWQHPKLGLVPPNDFISVAEMSNLIHPMSLWVVRHAIAQARRWMETGVTIPVAINLSAQNLMDTAFPEKIQSIIDEFGVPAEMLEIEITESSFIKDPARATLVLDQLHTMGCSVALDDFGTGFSSLSYLKRLPLDALKIDRSFVRDLLTDESDAVIVKSTIALSHSFGLQCVAEGVEDQATLDVLRQLGCDQVQGFFISKPLPLEAFNLWLTRSGE